MREEGLAKRICMACGKEFSYSPRHYLLMKYELPKRCPECSALTKEIPGVNQANRGNRICIWKGNVIVSPELQSLVSEGRDLVSGCRKWKLGSCRARLTVYDHRGCDALEGEAYLRVMYDRRGRYFYLVLEEVFNPDEGFKMELISDEAENALWDFKGIMKNGSKWFVSLREKGSKVPLC